MLHCLLESKPYHMRLIGGVVAMLWLGAAQASPVAQERLQQETETRLRAKIIPVLERYCAEACQLIGTTVEVDEEIGEAGDMGFETLNPQASSGRLFVARVESEVQIDDRVTQVNRERLEAMLLNHLRSYAPLAQVRWRAVQVPRIGKSGELEQQLRDRLEERLTQAVGRVIEQYCPDQCVIEKTIITGAMVAPDDATQLRSTQRVSDESGRTVLRIDQVEIDVSIDESISPESRAKIVNLMRTRTKFIEGVRFNVSVTAFPESYSQVKDRQKQEESDPYGLEKLRQMLIIFRELAGTKEIVSRSETLNNATERKESINSSKESNSANTNIREKTNNDSITKSNSSESQISKSASSEVQDGIGGFSKEELIYIAVGTVVLLLIVAAVLMKFSSANRAAQDLVIRSERLGANNGTAAAAGAGGVGSAVAAPEAQAQLRQETQQRLQVADMRHELITLFMEQPRVARDTFGRMLKEDGIEETAKYVKILGHMIVFELLDDPQMHRDIYQLSEYYHGSDLKFSLDEEMALLTKLKTRCTAAEIRVLSARASDKFEFLSKLESGQLYRLIADETTKVQSIVLTHLDRKRRMEVFDLYSGRARIELLAELAKVDGVPREYLFNVSRALQRKIYERPEFDVQTLQSAGLLLDLVEKSKFEEQKQLILALNTSNPESARALKQKLVTVEMLSFLKDGHLLEVIMGIEREDLLAFLIGIPEHIRRLILRKAPAELAESWMEDLANAPRLDEQTYRQAELKVLTKVRVLATSGVISLLDINNAIYVQAPAPPGNGPTRSATGGMSPATMVA